eukprot:2065416-Pyramimonas_sp.AAC.1
MDGHISIPTRQVPFDADAIDEGPFLVLPLPGAIHHLDFPIRDGCVPEVLWLRCRGAWPSIPPLPCVIAAQTG